MSTTEISDTTKFEKHKVSYTWRIENWSTVAFMQKEFQSKKFSFKEIDQSLYFFFNFASRTFEILLDSQDHYLTGLCIESDTPVRPMKVTTCAAVNKDKVPIAAFTVHQDVDYFEDDRSVVSLMTIPSANIDSKVIIDDSLTILIEIEYCHSWGLDNIIAIDDKSKKNYLILRNYHNLYEKQQLCDITFVINDDQFKAHTFVLALASPYFHSMLTQDTKESKDRIVNFSDDPDINSEVFKGFLDFIYIIKNISDLKKIALELLVLADKFDVKMLYESCEQYLAKIIDKNNAARLLIFSNKYNCMFLKQKVLDFSKNDVSIFTTSSEFAEMCKDEDLMSELLLNNCKI